MNTVYLSLGANIGDVKETLQKAIQSIERKLNAHAVTSSFYQTKAWGKTDQNDFINCCISIQTAIPPIDLLAITQSIEEELGRVRKEHWGPRLIDIDILFYETLVVETPTLKIPHPYIQNRNFVLTPLNEIAPTFVHPTLHRTISHLLEECSDNSMIQLIND